MTEHMTKAKLERRIYGRRLYGRDEYDRAEAEWEWAEERRMAELEYIADCNEDR